MDDDDDARNGNGRASGVVPVNALSEDFATSVATSESGIALIYQALDALVTEFELDDAAVVIDEPGLGRQVFCAGRRPLGPDDDELLISPPGLYTQPALDNQGFDRSLMARTHRHVDAGNAAWQAREVLAVGERDGHDRRVGERAELVAAQDHPGAGRLCAAADVERHGVAESRADGTRDG